MSMAVSDHRPIAMPIGRCADSTWLFIAPTWIARPPEDPFRHSTDPILRPSETALASLDRARPLPYPDNALPAPTGSHSVKRALSIAPIPVHNARSPLETFFLRYSAHHMPIFPQWE
jgi:hypothetical protein